MEQEKLTIAMFQYAIVWENKQANLDKIASWLEKERPEADLLVLPEMFTTGFSMTAKQLAETNEGETMQQVGQWAKRFNMAIAGSFIAQDDRNFYNRAFFITPGGESFFYDKRHLFTIGREDTVFTAGRERVIVPYKGWNICMQICYDLRFPVWVRNTSNEYDLLLYMANWPDSRISSWNQLLPARAVENQAYVCGINRVGENGLQEKYNGHSVIYDMKGKLLAQFEQGEESIKIATLSLGVLKEFRRKFPVWRDADRFEIHD